MNDENWRAAALVLVILSAVMSAVIVVGLVVVLTDVL